MDQKVVFLVKRMLMFTRSVCNTEAKLVNVFVSSQNVSYLLLLVYDYICGPPSISNCWSMSP